MVKRRAVPVLTALQLIAGVAGASAQTVVVTNAPEGTAVEFVLNNAVQGSATVGADGLAVVRATSQAQPTDPGVPINALVWIETCTDRRRILVVDRNVPPPEAGACSRAPIDGVYRITPVTSLLVDFGPAVPALRIRQGEVPAGWLTGEAPEDIVAESRVPVGFVLSGGGGLGAFKDFSALMCGQVPCEEDMAPPMLAASVTYWVRPFFGVEAGLYRPGAITASATVEGSFSFESEQDGGMLALMAVGGLPIGPLRLLGGLGMNYQRSTLTTAQTLEEVTLETDEGPVFLPGGSQTMQVRTQGWGYVFKAGAEYWFNRRLAVYGEGGRLFLRGSDVGESETELDDKVAFGVVGVRLAVPGF